jgi:hypothetical protein
MRRQDVAGADAERISVLAPEGLPVVRVLREAGPNHERARDDATCHVMTPFLPT